MTVAMPLHQRKGKHCVNQMSGTCEDDFFSDSILQFTNVKTMQG